MKAFRQRWFLNAELPSWRLPEGHFQPVNDG